MVVVLLGGFAPYGIAITTYLSPKSYVHYLFKSEKPADLPIQAPTKFEWLTIRQLLFATAVEVIEKSFRAAIIGDREMALWVNHDISGASLDLRFTPLSTKLLAAPALVPIATHVRS